jgi:thermitase
VKSRCLQIATAITASSLAAAGASAQSLCNNGAIACRQVVLKLQLGQSIEAVAVTFGATVARSIPARRTFLLELPPQTNLQAVLNGLCSDPRVAWAEPNRIKHAPSGTTQSFFLSMTTHSQYTSQYCVELMQVQAAHQFSTGAGVRIAVLDTGLDVDHPLFAGRIAAGGWNFVEDTPDVADVGNGLDDNGNNLIDELTGHGTMVSGLSLLVAPQARILPLKILNSDGVGTAFYMAQAIDAAVASGARIISISAGANIPSHVVQDAVNGALAADRIVIASVGNSDRESPPLYPAAYPGVLAIAGTDQDDIKASFSDYGLHVSLSAPAVAMIGPMPANAYALADGTSFAAPLASGSAALIAELQPAASSSLITSFLMQHSSDISAANPAYTGRLGQGRLHIGAASAAAAAGPSCYANCDHSTATPLLNIADFSCFLQAFAAASALPASQQVSHYANCDLSTTEPVLNVADFGCFLQRFAAGCR